MKLPKHHYIPVFYLKKWARPDGRIVEFSRPYGDLVKPRYVHPDGTGYIRGLYRLPGVSDEVAELMESRFLKAVDDSASYAQLKLLRKSFDYWNPGTRSAWSRFIMGTLMRSPKTLADIKARLSEGLPDEWDKLRTRLAQQEPDAPALKDYDPVQVERRSIMAIQRFINNPSVGNYLNNMLWSVVDTSNTRYRFLTSDRPIVMTNGIGFDHSHIAVPVSPTILFLATNTPDMTNSIQAMPVREIVFNCNKQVVRHAVKYVWASDESQAALIKAQMSDEAHNDRNFFRETKSPDGRLVDSAKKLLSKP